jgi:hypothetical protein
MARFGLGRQHRHTPHGRGGGLSPLAIVGICLAAAILLTVLVGNILRVTLSEEIYNRLTQGPAEKAPVPNDTDRQHPQIKAPAFLPGEDSSSLVGYTAASLAINQPTGKVYYASPVSLYQGLAEEGSPLLEDVMIELSVLTPYVSGVYYAQGAFAQGSDLRYAKAMEEGALLREFYRMGGREAVIAGIPFASLRNTEVLDYVKALKQAVGEMPVGVAVPLSVAEAEGAWELLGALAECCDFLVLDLSDEVLDPDCEEDDFGLSKDAVAILSRAEYYRMQYRMRLLLGEKQEDLLAAVQHRLISDYQTEKDFSRE